MVFHSVLATRAVLQVSAAGSKDFADSGCTLSRYRMPTMAFATVGDAGIPSVAEVIVDPSLILEEIR
jgi:hypothetical protein